MSRSPLFKIKLASGRVLGPLDLDRVAQLVLNGSIAGTEVAREYPAGEWMDINQIAPLSELIVQAAAGTLQKASSEGVPAAVQAGVHQALIPTVVLPGSEGAEALAPTLPTALPGTEARTELQPRTLAPIAPAREAHEDLPSAASIPVVAVEAPPPVYEPVTRALEPRADTEEKTVVASPAEFEKTVVGSTEDELASPPSDEASLERASGYIGGSDSKVQGLAGMLRPPPPRNIANERTIVFQRSKTTAGKDKGHRKRTLPPWVRSLAVALLVGFMAYDFMFEEPPKAIPGRPAPVRPALPSYVQGKSNPEQSAKLYGEAMRDYVQDTVAGYRRAAAKLRLSAGQDITNVKALAMLASTYLNLIDSSNKDENYFAVISKLIDMSRAKNVDTEETVIADVEFYLTVNKGEAAQNRIVDYTKNHSFGTAMFYYIALTFMQRGDLANATRYLSQVPEKNIFSAKVFLLRGRLAEALGDVETALKEYEKGYRFYPDHARSRLKISELLNKKGRLKEAGRHLDFLMNRIELLSPPELAQAYFLHAQLAQLYQKFDVALGDMERAVKLDRENHDYQLELYTLRAKAGDASVKGVQKEARMYYFLGEGEKQLRLGGYHEALVQYLLAREANPNAVLPLMKIGEMFEKQHDLGNAALNYKLAADRAPRSIEVWSKYIHALIQSYDWEEAQKAMDKFRTLPVPQSAIDKAAADLLAKQNRPVEAQVYYKKAMARDIVDPDTYIEYAKSLMATKNYREAPFFFALALRFDPLNMDAIIGTAKCVAASDSIDRAITMLQDELNKSTKARAELLGAIADFYIQKGAWEAAQQNVDQARAADPDYAYAWKLQAQIHINNEGVDKNAVEKALAAYQSFSERNPSDATGYLERYNLFLKKADFEKASEELNKVYAIYPKYPNFHFYKGFLYGLQGNHRVAADEYSKELKNNPRGVKTLIALGKELVELGQVAGPGGAQERFNLAMQIQPTNAEAKQYAGYAAYLLKNYAAAVALYNSALVFDKANPMIFKRLGMAYRDMGDQQQAAFAFRKYLEMEPDAVDRAEFERYR